MKIALILHGFFRTFDFCKNSLLENIINPLNCDVFINAPTTSYTAKKDEIPHLHSVFSRDDKTMYQSLECFGNNLVSCDLRKYNSNFYKQKVIDEKFPQLNTFGQENYRVLSTMHSISLSVQTFKKHVELTGNHYDLVILTRPDVKYYTNFNPGVVDLTKLNCPAYFCIAPEHEQLVNLPFQEKIKAHIRKRPNGAGVYGMPGRWFNDQVMCGSQETILKYSSFFDKAPDYFREGITFTNETCIAFHAIKNGIDFCGTDFITYDLWRLTQSEY